MSWSNWLHEGPEAWDAGSHGEEEGQADAVGQAPSQKSFIFICSVPLAWILRVYRSTYFTHRCLSCQLGSIPQSHSWPISFSWLLLRQFINEFC